MHVGGKYTYLFEKHLTANYTIETKREHFTGDNKKKRTKSINL